MDTLLSHNNKGLYFIAGEGGGLRRPTEEELAQLRAAQEAAKAQREAINNATSEQVSAVRVSGLSAPPPSPPDDFPEIPAYIELEGGRWLFNVRTHRFNDEAGGVEVLPYSSLMEIIAVKEAVDAEVFRLEAQGRELARQAELIDAANQARLYALEERIAELEGRVKELEGPHGWEIDIGPPEAPAPGGPPVDNTGDRDGKPPIEWEVDTKPTQEREREEGAE